MWLCGGTNVTFSPMNVPTPLELSEKTLRRMLGLATDHIVAFTQDIPNQPVDTSSAMNANELGKRGDPGHVWNLSADHAGHRCDLRFGGCPAAAQSRFSTLVSACRAWSAT